jgi:hypothetical protein
MNEGELGRFVALTRVWICKRVRDDDEVLPGL